LTNLCISIGIFYFNAYCSNTHSEARPFENATNHLPIGYIISLKKIREKGTNFKIKMMLISTFLKSDINIDGMFRILKIDKVIEKPIRLENLKEEVKRLLD